MFRKTSVFILIVASASVASLAQTSETKKEVVRPLQTFAWTMDGDGGYLGVQTQEITKENFSKFGLSSVRGVAVEMVMDGSPAQTAGLQTGDVIVRFENEEITSVRKLTRLISEVAADHQVKLTVLRGNIEQQISATLAKRPSPKFENGAFSVARPMGRLSDLPSMPGFPPMGELPRTMTVPGPDGFERREFRVFAGGRQIGIGVTQLTKQLSSHYGVDGGLLITDVRESSPAAKAGLKAGDIVVEADGKSVKADIDLIRTIQEKKDGDVQITFVRERNRQTVNVTPEASKDKSFLFQTEDDDGLTLPTAPQLFKMVTPATPTSPTAPMAAPAVVTGFRMNRII